MTKTKGALAVIAAGLAVAATASGQNPPQTLKFTTTQGEERFVDLGKHGESAGDRFLISSTIHMQGKPAGRVEAECYVLDKAFKGFTCSGSAILPDGQLTFQGTSVGRTLPGGVTAKKSIYAITGGTGAYTGASGTATRTGNGNGKTDSFVVALS